MNTSIAFSDLFSIINDAFRLREIHLSADSENLADLDFHFRENVLGNYDYRALFDEMTASVSPTYPVNYEDSLGAHYIILQDPCDPPDTYIFIGPALFQRFTDQDFEPLVARNQIPLSHLNDVKYYMARLTLVSDPLAFRQIFDSLFPRWIGEDVHLHFVRSKTTRVDEQRLEAKAVIPESVAQFSSLAARYDMEHGMTKAVTEGNVKEAIHYHNLFMGFVLDPRTGDELRDGKNMVIAVDTLLRKAAEDAYVHPLYLDHISRTMVTQIEGINNVLELTHFVSTMIRRYCLLVKSHSRREYSPMIRDVLSYIDFNYQEKLSLSTLAEQFSVSKSHLSTVFHKEVHQTVTDYINSVRVERAILLLNTTSDSMPLIAEKCGFSDANYFTRTFKKMKGMSPLQYRNMMERKE